MLRDVRPEDQQVLRERLERVTGDARWVRVDCDDRGLGPHAEQRGVGAPDGEAAHA